MRKKMYWGLVSLILIIGVVGVYFMLQPEPDPEPEKKFIAPSEADIEKAREARQPPPGASPNGHWHNGEWHEEPHIVEDYKPTQPPSTVEKNNGNYVDIDFSVFDNPKELTRKHAEILLNPEKHSIAEVDRAFQESLLFNEEIKKRFGIGEYYNEIGEYRDKVLTDPFLKKQGTSLAEIKAEVRGEIPPKIIPPHQFVLPEIDGGDK